MNSEICTGIRPQIENMMMGPIARCCSMHIAYFKSRDSAKYANMTTHHVVKYVIWYTIHFYELSILVVPCVC